jgi:DNA-directed RNA polymerase specialized sigma24 family protein
VAARHTASLLLRDIEAYSYKEIAELLGVGVGTVGSRESGVRLILGGGLVEPA